MANLGDASHGALTEQIQASESLNLVFIEQIFTSNSEVLFRSVAQEIEFWYHTLSKLS